jgi:superfamily II DNA or RNA helicase
LGVCIFDEAHHAIGESYQKLIFENDVCEKQIFFTATPKNANGIVMYDRSQEQLGSCGKLVYDYSYLRGMNEDYLNPIELRFNDIVFRARLTNTEDQETYKNKYLPPFE